MSDLPDNTTISLKATSDDYNRGDRIVKKNVKVFLTAVADFRVAIGAAHMFSDFFRR
jgi:hypothetical protein